MSEHCPRAVLTQMGEPPSRPLPLDPSLLQHIGGGQGSPPGGEVWSVAKPNSSNPSGGDPWATTPPGGELW